MAKYLLKFNGSIAFKMYAAQFASHTPSTGSISIHDGPVYVEADDFEGVHIAVHTLAEDFARVTVENPPEVISRFTKETTTETAVIVGSLTRSSVVRTLVQEGKLDVSTIDGQWECYTTKIVADPIPGVKRALVIAGSDKRGTIYGVYTLSEQIGVSP
jgi:hypothetical protein